MDFFDVDNIDSEIDGSNAVEGTPGNDNLTGGTGGSTITGQDGNDTLTGGTGGSNLSGNAGNDVLSGGSGSSTLTGGTGDDSLTGGSGSNTLTGDDGNDILIGGSGSNTFNGGAGEDRLVGGVGSNTLTGGSEADTFYFSKVEFGEGSTVVIGGEAINVGENSTLVLNGETVTEEDESNNPINTIADFNTAEGDKIQLDANSFGVTPGDTSTLTFDNSTEVLSLGDYPVVRVTNGVDSEVLANTEIIAGGDGGDATATNGEVPEGEEANNTDGILDVYRFFETEKGFHFYTSSETEKDAVQQQIDNNELSYSYEGESFAALAEDDDGDPLTGAKPVYRFFNNLTGAHLYTISETEKNNIVDNLPDYNLEGVAYYAYDEPQENTIPLYRLYNSETGTHFFTPSASEKDNVIETLPQYDTEGNDGVAFHVLATE